MKPVNRARPKAARFLQEKGYEIMARNFRYQHAEIDLVAKKGKMMVFVEVKTRTNLSFGNPEEFVSYAKAKLVMKAAEHYIFTHNWQFDVRFDILAIFDSRRRTSGEARGGCIFLSAKKDRVNHPAVSRHLTEISSGSSATTYVIKEEGQLYEAFCAFGYLSDSK